MYSPILTVMYYERPQVMNKSAFLVLGPVGRGNFLSFADILDQIFFCDPVVIELICYCKRAKRLINEGYTTGGL